MSQFWSIWFIIIIIIIIIVITVNKANEIPVYKFYSWWLKGNFQFYRKVNTV